MKKDDWYFVATMLGIIVAILSLLYQRAETLAATNGASPFNVSTQGSTFNFGGGNAGAGNLGNLGSIQPVTSSCGCGGSYGDYATTELSPVFGAAIRLLPGEPYPNDPPSILPALLPG